MVHCCSDNDADDADVDDKAPVLEKDDALKDERVCDTQHCKTNRNMILS